MAGDGSHHAKHTQTGPRAEEAYPVTIPMNMPVRIENDGDYPIGYTIV
jgi:hypothetical protein